MTITRLEPDQVEAVVDDLAEVLVDCVAGGASVGFLAPLAPEEAVGWWRATLGSAGLRTWIAADEAGSVVGSVMLSLESRPNGHHRAEVRKLLVHRRARGRGLGTALMQRAEQDALALGRTLLLLDTETGSAAETLYLRSGWAPFGSVTGHAFRPDGTLGDTTFMVKHLGAV